MYIFLEDFAKIAPLGTFLVAVFAVLIAYRQLRLVRQNEAKRQYSNFLLNSADQKIDDDFVNGTVSSKNINQRKYHKYHWYLSSLLFSAEEILQTHPRDIAWEKTITNALSIHKEALKSIDIYCYNLELRNILFKITAE